MQKSNPGQALPLCNRSRRTPSPQGMVHSGKNVMPKPSRASRVWTVVPRRVAALCGNAHKRQRNPGCHRTRRQPDDAAQPAGLQVSGSAATRGKFIFVKNDAQAFVGKTDRIGRLAIRSARKNKLDHAFAANCPDRIADTIFCPGSFTHFTHGVFDELAGGCLEGFDFPLRQNNCRSSSFLSHRPANFSVRKQTYAPR
jgi:hypothetical protein